jgi:hypothetical protein
MMSKHPPNQPAMKTLHLEKAEREFEIKDNLRARNESKAWDRFCRRSDQAETMIGEIIKNGETVFYVWPAGGKYREGSKAELIEFLLRNNYA